MEPSQPSQVLRVQESKGSVATENHFFLPKDYKITVGKDIYRNLRKTPFCPFPLGNIKKGSVPLLCKRLTLDYVLFLTLVETGKSAHTSTSKDNLYALTDPLLKNLTLLSPHEFELILDNSPVASAMMQQS